MKTLYSAAVNRFSLLLPKEELVESFRLHRNYTTLHTELIKISEVTGFFDMQSSDNKNSLDNFNKVIQTNDITIIGKYNTPNDNNESIRTYSQNFLDVNSISHYTFVKINNESLFQHVVKNGYRVKHSIVGGISYYVVLFDNQLQLDNTIQLCNNSKNCIIRYGRLPISDNAILPIVKAINGAVGTGLSGFTYNDNNKTSDNISIFPTKDEPIVTMDIDVEHVPLIHSMLIELGNASISKYNKIKLRNDVVFIIGLLQTMNIPFYNVGIYLSSRYDNAVLLTRKPKQ